ncbi:hypothetical protein WJ30_27470 [Burkholderia diffusa]|nr:hypothetical protein WJ30_27470 [Burkholderia diffusa]
MKERAGTGSASGKRVVMRDAGGRRASRVAHRSAGWRTQPARHANVLLRMVHPRLSIASARTRSLRARTSRRGLARIGAEAAGPATMSTTWTTDQWTNE